MTHNGSEHKNPKGAKMIKIITEINKSKIIGFREMPIDYRSYQVICADGSIHETDQPVDTSLPTIESVAMRINSNKPIMTGNMRLKKKVQ